MKKDLIYVPKLFCVTFALCFQILFAFFTFLEIVIDFWILKLVLFDSLWNSASIDTTHVYVHVRSRELHSFEHVTSGDVTWRHVFTHLVTRVDHISTRTWMFWTWLDCHWKSKLHGANYKLHTVHNDHWENYKLQTTHRDKHQTTKLQARPMIKLQTSNYTLGSKYKHQTTKIKPHTEIEDQAINYKLQIRSTIKLQTSNYTLRSNYKAQTTNVTLRTTITDQTTHNRLQTSDYTQGSMIKLQTSN